MVKDNMIAIRNPTGKHGSAKIAPSDGGDGGTEDFDITQERSGTPSEKERKEAVIATFKGVPAQQRRSAHDALRRKSQILLADRVSEARTRIEEFELHQHQPNRLKILCESAQFTKFVFFVIFLAFFTAVVQTFKQSRGHVFTNVLDWFVRIAFVIECVLKVGSEWPRPWLYLITPDPQRKWFHFRINGWNLFDATITFLALGMPSVSFLRLMRVLRVQTMLFRAVPALRMIAQGLVGGMKSIGYICVLLMLMLYIYGIAGYYFFYPNDPVHFGNLMLSVTTLFRSATLEDWTDVMYINMYGCNSTEGENFGGYVLGNETKHQTGLMVMYDPKCSESRKSLFVSPVFFVSFVVLSSFVMLSLFIGAVTLSMNDAISEMKQTKSRAVFEKKYKLAQDKVARQQRQLLKHTRSSRRILQSASSFKHLVGFGQKTLSGVQMWAGLVQLWATRHEDVLKARDAKLSGWRRKYARLSARARRQRDSTWFVNTMNGVIIIAGLNAGMVTAKLSDRISGVVDALDNIIFFLYCYEFVVKVVAERFKPQDYLKDAWNRLDFMIIFTQISFYLVSAFVSFDGKMGPKLLNMMRLARLLRVLQLVKTLPQLRLIVHALLEAAHAMQYIFVILLLFYSFFALIAVEMFGENDPTHFQNFAYAILTLFRCATLEDWTDVMYIQMFGCMRYDQGFDGKSHATCTPAVNRSWGWFGMLYFAVFIIVGSFVLLSLFIGVVTATMEEAADQMKQTYLMERKCTKLRKAHKIPSLVVDHFRSEFGRLDIDKHGEIEKEEMMLALIGYGEAVEPREAAAFFNLLDTDSSGSIDFAEFLQFMCDVNRSKGNFARLIYLRKYVSHDVPDHPLPSTAKMFRDYGAQPESPQPTVSKRLTLSGISAAILSPRRRHSILELDASSWLKECRLAMDGFQPGESIADGIRRICRDIDSGKLKFDGPGMTEVIIDRSLELAHEAKLKLSMHGPGKQESERASVGKQESERASVGKRMTTRRRSVSESILRTTSSGLQQSSNTELLQGNMQEVVKEEAGLHTEPEKPQTDHNSIREPAAIRHTLNTRRFMLQKGLTNRQLSRPSLERLQHFLQDKTQGMEETSTGSDIPVVKGVAGKQMRDAVRKLAGLEMAENATAAIRVETEKMVDEVSAYFMSLATANVRAQADEMQRRLLASEAAAAALRFRLQQSEAQLHFVAAESDRRAAQRHARTILGARPMTAFPTVGSRSGAAAPASRPSTSSSRPLSAQADRLKQFRSNVEAMRGDSMAVAQSFANVQRMIADVKEQASPHPKRLNKGDSNNGSDSINA